MSNQNRALCSRTIENAHTRLGQMQHHSVIVPIVSDFRANRQDAELEIRIGNFVGEKFVAGLDRDKFEHLEKDMERDFKGDERWSQVVDYFYVMRTPDARTVNVRTRVAVDAQGIDINTEHVEKIPMRATVFTCADDGFPQSNHNAFKIIYSRERIIDHPPSTCIPAHVRIKLTRRFRDIRAGSVTWVYELSKTWSASSRSAVEYAQDNHTPVYEVECELVDRERAYVEGKTDDFIARSLLAKARLLVGEEGDSTSFRLVDENPSHGKRKLTPRRGPSLENNMGSSR